MKKSEMVIGAEHAVEFPAGEAYVGRYNVPAHVKATVLEVGLVRSGRFGGNARNDGVRCRLEAPIRTIEGVGRGDGFCAREPGHEFEVASRDVHRSWNCGHDDDAGQAAREARYTVQDELRVIFERLGAPKVELVGDGAAISAAELLRWLKRIDPTSIAGQAIGLFVEALDREGEDLPTDGVVEHAKAAAVQEVVEGVAVTDVEIGAGGEG